MLSRLLSRSPVFLRGFSELQSFSGISNVGPSEPIVTSVGSLDLDFDSIPQYTLGNYQDRMSTVFLNYMSSLRGVQGGRFNKAIFESIEVYSFMEHVSLNLAADVEQVSETTFKITAYDPTNSPTIEIALKKSNYHMSVHRDFEHITVNMKVDKQACKDAALKIVQTAKKNIDAIVGEAGERFQGNKQAANDIEELGKRVAEDIDFIHQEKIEQISN